MRLATYSTHAEQGGTALLEALLAFVFLAVGAAATVRLEGTLRLHAELGRQRSEAVRLGQRELETLRAFAAVAAASGVRAYVDISDGETSVDGASGYVGNTAYRVVRQVDDAAFAGAKAASISVEWNDRQGAAQRVVLDSVIAGSDPAYIGALSIAAAPRRGAFGRSPRVPFAAKTLGDGRSVWKPAAAGSVAVVFDDASGAIVARCSGIPAATRDLSVADLASCVAGRWLLLSGTIRFTSAIPPLAAQANELPLPLAPSLALMGGNYPAAPECGAEAMKTVRYLSGGSVRIEAVAIDASPASVGTASWEETGERFASYRCLVVPRADGRWSGRVTLVPSGWTIGIGSAAWRVCRFASDRDGSGAIDANIEHPAEYVDANEALTEQNFLVVRGNQTCPAATDGGALSASGGTVQQQP